MKKNKAVNIISNIKGTESKINSNDVIKMKFLEQSAQYLGVYVKNRPAGYLCLGEHLLN